MIILLLINVVVLYFATPDRRYVLAALTLLGLESFTLALMWLLNWPSVIGYAIGLMIIMAILAYLLFREDRQLQHSKSKSLYIEHSPVEEVSTDYMTKMVKRS